VGKTLQKQQTGLPGRRRGYNWVDYDKTSSGLGSDAGYLLTVLNIRIAANYQKVVAPKWY